MGRICIYLILGLLSLMAMVSCQHELPGGFEVELPKTERGSVVVLTRTETEGILSLSVDAAAESRQGVWIDLDGDGLRAEDGSENVKIFNSYQSYDVKEGLKEVAIHGDITYLGAASNELSGVDVSGSPYLTTLNIPQNRLTSLDVSENKALSRLDCSGNSLSSLDVSQNGALLSLWVFDNKITSIDVSQNSNLSFLDCSGNSLASLDVSTNIHLEHLLAYNNKIRELDVSENTQLTRLWLFGNPLSESVLHQIVSSLRSVSGGELWLSDGALGKAVASDATAKGWSVEILN